MEDLLLNTNQELQVVNGDLATGESTEQHQDLLIMTNKGEWKENPTIAVGILGFLKEEDESGLLAEIKTQFEKDGMAVKSIANIEGKVIVDANY